MAIINCDCEVCGKPKISGYCRNPECKMFVDYANDLEESLGRISERDIEHLQSLGSHLKGAIVVGQKFIEVAETIRKQSDNLVAKMRKEQTMTGWVKCTHCGLQTKIGSDNCCQRCGKKQ